MLFQPRNSPPFRAGPNRHRTAFVAPVKLPFSLRSVEEGLFRARFLPPGPV
jgi:hypothetical protein